MNTPPNSPSPNRNPINWAPKKFGARSRIVVGMNNTARRRLVFVECPPAPKKLGARSRIVVGMNNKARRKLNFE